MNRNVSDNIQVSEDISTKMVGLILVVIVSLSAFVTFLVKYQFLMKLTFFKNLYIV